MKKKHLQLDPAIAKTLPGTLEHQQKVQWYLDHQEWLDNITSGEYEKYYEEMYKGR